MNVKDYNVISFRTVYYTLWNVHEELTEYGKVEHYHFVKNISQDKAVVDTLYPNLEFVADLRGHDC